MGIIDLCEKMHEGTTALSRGPEDLSCLGPGKWDQMQAPSSVTPLPHKDVTSTVSRM